jgi:superfamily II RNA helicase
VAAFKKQQLFLALMFTFSKKNCEKFTMFLGAQGLISDYQKTYIGEFFVKAITRLRPEDRGLPQVNAMRNMLLISIGVHHRGMLLIFKEIIEIPLLGGFIHVLICMSTFVICINVPARSRYFISSTGRR